MKRPRMKHLVFGLVAALALSATGALATLSVSMSTTNLSLDGKPISPAAYAINGNNYFKLRDMAEALDFGVTYDKASNTALITSDGHYKPEATQMITGNWASATRTRIQSVIDANANKGRYVVFDFDNTSAIFDVQEALLIYQAENLIFKIEPAKMKAVLETGIPDLTKVIGKNADGKSVTVNDVVADLVSSYTWITTTTRA